MLNEIIVEGQRVGRTVVDQGSAILRAPALRLADAGRNFASAPASGPASIPQSPAKLSRATSAATEDFGTRGLAAHPMDEYDGSAR